MGSFSLDFPDDDIDAILGDEVTLIFSGGGTQIVLGEFDFKFMEEELGDRIDIKYPIFDCNDSYAKLIKKNTLMKFNGNAYKLYKKLPIDTGKTRVYMKLL